MPDGSHLRRPADAGALTLPNVITFGRLCAVPAAVWLVLHGDYLTAFWLFALAGASDALDGWLARRMGSSQLGAVMDPAADKALLVSMFVTLAAVHALPDWLAILVVFRDVVIVGGLAVLVLGGQQVQIRPLFVSKLNTTVQILMVGTGLLAAASLPIPLWTISGLIWLTATTTLVSGAAYVWKGTR